MKELKYLNKYLLKYKSLMLLGFLFVVISTVFQIIPAQMVRYAIDLVVDNIRLYHSFEKVTVRDAFFDVFARGILLYAGLILLMALLRGVFLYFVRQTLIVMSRLVEYDLKNEIFQHYESFHMIFNNKNNTGALMNRISEDVGRVLMYLGPSIMYGMQLVVLFNQKSTRLNSSHMS